MTGRAAGHCSPQAFADPAWPPNRGRGYGWRRRRFRGAGMAEADWLRFERELPPTPDQEIARLETEIRGLQLRLERLRQAATAPQDEPDTNERTDG